MKAQVSFEYLLVVGIALLFIVGGVMLFFNYSQRSNEDITASTITKIGNDLVGAVEKVYYVGGDSWETLRFNIPTSVKNIYILNVTELVIKYETFGTMSEAIFFTDINMTTPFAGGNISSQFHPGLNVIRVVSQGAVVNISEIS